MASQRSVLYLCHRLPYAPDKGCRIRAFHHLEGLAQGSRVHLLSFAERRSDLALTARLREFCASVEVVVQPRALSYLRCALSSWRRRPLTHSFYDSARLRRRALALASAHGCEAVLAYSSAMAPYARALPGVRRVLDMVDVDSEKWRQYAERGPIPMRPIHALEAARMRRYEAAAVADFDVVTLATERETQLLRGFAPAGEVVTVAQGIDLEFYRPTATPKSPAPSLLFVGQMDYYPNVDAASTFAKRVLPLLRARFPDLELVVVGRAPTRTVQGLSGLPGVTVTGEVEDIRPFLARAWAFVAPLRIAQGIQNKVLEAIASDLPVVASEPVFAGLADAGFRRGEDMLVVPDGERAVHQIALLLGDAALRERLAAAARRRLIAAYSWEGSARHLAGLLLGEQPAAGTRDQRQRMASA